MNDRNLAIQISKHPLIELLKKDRTIPNNLVARLIVEELMLETADEAVKQIESSKSLEELEKIYKELEPSISGMPRVRGTYEDKKKELAAAQPKKKPEDIKGLIVDTLGDAVADQIVAKIVTPVLNKVNIVAAGASTTGGPLAMLARAAIGKVAQQGIEFAVEKACKAFVNSVLSSFKAVDTISDKLGDLFGKSLEGKISDPGISLEGKKKLIAENALLIFQNFLIGGAQNKFGSTVQESIISTLGMEIDLPIVGAIPIGSVITKQLLGPEVAQSIDKGYAALESLEAQAEQLEGSKKNLEAKISQLKELLDNPQLKELYELIQAEGSAESFKDLPDILSEGPTKNLTKAKTSLEDGKFQTAAELIVTNLKTFMDTLFKAAAELKKYPTKDRKDFSQQVLTFKESYKTGQEILLAIENEIEKIKKEIESVEAQEVEVDIPQQTTDTPQEPIAPSTDPTSEPGSEEGQPEAGEEEGQPEAGEEGQGEKEEVEVEFGEQNQQEFVNAATRFQTEFYKQRKRKAQGVIINTLIDAIDKLVEDTELEDAYIQSPKPEKEELEEDEDTEKINQQAQDDYADKLEKIEANEKQLKAVKLEFRTLLQRINKAKKVLDKFKDYAERGNVLADSTKEEFMLLLEKLQESIGRIVTRTRNIIESQQTIQENEELDKRMQKHREVEKLYNSSLQSIISLRDLLAEKSTNVKPEELIKTAYEQLINLSQYFPSVNPFNVGVKSKKDLKKYDAAFDTAVEDVKSSLQNVLSFIKTFESSSDSLQYALEGIEEFSGKIQSIFGVNSKIQKVVIDPDEPAAVEVEGDLDDDAQEDDFDIEEEWAEDAQQKMLDLEPVEMKDIPDEAQKKELKNVEPNSVLNSVEKFLKFIKRVYWDYVDDRFEVELGTEDQPQNLKESIKSKIKRMISRSKSDEEFFNSIIGALKRHISLSSNDIMKSTSAFLNFMDPMSGDIAFDDEKEALMFLWDFEPKQFETKQAQEYGGWTDRGNEREEVLKAYKIPFFSNWFKPELTDEGIGKMIKSVDMGSRPEERDSNEPTFEEEPNIDFDLDDDDLLRWPAGDKEEKETGDGDGWGELEDSVEDIVSEPEGEQQNTDEEEIIFSFKMIEKTKEAFVEMIEHGHPNEGFYYVDLYNNEFNQYHYDDGKFSEEINEPQSENATKWRQFVENRAPGAKLYVHFWTGETDFPAFPAKGETEQEFLDSLDASLDQVKSLNLDDEFPEIPEPTEEGLTPAQLMILEEIANYMSDLGEGSKFLKTSVNEETVKALDAYFFYSEPDGTIKQDTLEEWPGEPDISNSDYDWVFEDILSAAKERAPYAYAGIIFRDGKNEISRSFGYNLESKKESVINLLKRNLKPADPPAFSDDEVSQMTDDSEEKSEKEKKKFKKELEAAKQEVRRYQNRLEKENRKRARGKGKKGDVEFEERQLKAAQEELKKLEQQKAQFDIEENIARKLKSLIRELMHKGK